MGSPQRHHYNDLRPSKFFVWSSVAQTLANGVGPGACAVP